MVVSEEVRPVWEEEGEGMRAMSQISKTEGYLVNLRPRSKGHDLASRRTR